MRQRSTQRSELRNYVDSQTTPPNWQRSRDEGFALDQESNQPRSPPPPQGVAFWVVSTRLNFCAHQLILAQYIYIYILFS